MPSTGAAKAAQNNRRNRIRDAKKALEKAVMRLAEREAWLIAEREARLIAEREASLHGADESRSTTPVDPQMQQMHEQRIAERVVLALDDVTVMDLATDATDEASEADVEVEGTLQSRLVAQKVAPSTGGGDTAPPKSVGGVVIARLVAAPLDAPLNAGGGVSSSTAEPETSVSMNEPELQLLQSSELLQLLESSMVEGSALGTALEGSVSAWGGMQAIFDDDNEQASSGAASAGRCGRGENLRSLNWGTAGKYGPPTVTPDAAILATTGVDGSYCSETGSDLGSDDSFSSVSTVDDIHERSRAHVLCLLHALERTADDRIDAQVHSMLVARCRRWLHVGAPTRPTPAVAPAAEPPCGLAARRDNTCGHDDRSSACGHPRGPGSVWSRALRCLCPYTATPLSLGP